MALPRCNPCGCIPANVPNDKFKQDVEILLCDILTALGGGPTPGGGCVYEVTTAELNALIAEDGIHVNCTYIITDQDQNRVPSGTRVAVLGLSENQVSSEAGVLTSYDTTPWRGVYDQATNKLRELWDNQGNYASNYNPFGGADKTCVDDFDWGNTGIEGCSVIGSQWILAYGRSVAYRNITITGNSTLDLTNYAGTFLENITITAKGLIDLSDGDTDMSNVEVSNQGRISAQGDQADFWEKIVVQDSNSRITTSAGNGMLIESVNVTNGGTIDNIGTGVVRVWSTNVFNYGRITANATLTGGILIDNIIDSCNVMGGNSGIILQGTSDSETYIFDVQLESGGNLEINDLTAPALIDIEGTSVTTGGLLRVQPTLGDVTILSCEVSSAGRIETGTIAATGSAFFEALTVRSSGAISVAPIDGNISFSSIDVANFATLTLLSVDDTGTFDMINSRLDSGGTLTVYETESDISINNIEVVSGGNLEFRLIVAPGTDLHHSSIGDEGQLVVQVIGSNGGITIRQGTFITAGFNQNHIYILGNNVITATMANTSKGSDFFNTNIV